MSTEIESQRLIFPGLAGFYRLGAPYSYAFMRFATGAVLAPHGIQKLLYNSVEKFAPNIGGKGLPFPELLTYLTFATESAAAICLAIGLFTRVAAAMIWIEMAVRAPQCLDRQLRGLAVAILVQPPDELAEMVRQGGAQPRLTGRATAPERLCLLRKTRVRVSISHPHP